MVLGLASGASAPAFASGASAAALAKTGTSKAAEAGETPKLPEPLTRKAIRDVLSKISDDQVRKLLLKELDDKVKAHEAELAKNQDRSLFAIVAGLPRAIAEDFKRYVSQIGAIAPELRKTARTFLAARGGTGLWWLPATLLMCLAAGIVAAIVVRQLLVSRLDPLLQTATNVSLWRQLQALIMRFFAQAGHLLGFVAAAHGVNAMVNASAAADASFISYIINATSWTWLAIICARFLLSPAQPWLRLCSADDETAWFLTRRIGLIFGWSAFAFGLIIWAMGYGWVIAKTNLGFWVNVIFHLLIIATLWQGRAGIAALALGQDQDVSPMRRRLAAAWPMVSIGLVLFGFLVVELFVATGNVNKLSLSAINITLVLVLGLPLIGHAIRHTVQELWPEDPEQEEALRAAHRQSQLGVARCIRLVVLIGLFLFILKLWGLDLHDLAEQGVGAQIASALMQLIAIFVISYGLWQALNIMADRQIAIEKVMLGQDDEHESPAEVGGKGGTRLGTLLPLIRTTGRVVIVALATLAVLGQLGVNIAPLLAGAGIIGLAVGFGAQTLVKDIISGIFFLIDDAFRKGEYIDIGEVKGTVEKISIRSMQLRHHRGPLNTVPFGEIRHLTNYSRDWVMMKLPIRVTYDTDVERLRKLIKRLGQEMLEDEELGPMFLEPLKSQGVIQMDDSAMIIRVKFMTRPGDQFALRNKIFSRLRELFEKEDIKFAHREVTVRIADDDPHHGHLTETQRKEAAAAAARSVIEKKEKSH